LLPDVRILLVLSLFVSVAHAEPSRRRVHVDHVDPAKISQFEQARTDWVAWVAAHHVVDPWGGTLLQVGGSTFLTVRAFMTWAELDAKPTAKLDPAAQATYNDRSDDALVPPHHSEIWMREPELDYAAIDLVGVGTITYDEIALTDAYEKAWAQIRTELAAAKYPIARVAFFSQYGSGLHVSLWLAPNRAAYDAAPTIDQVLVKRLGQAKATALLTTWRGAVVHHEELPLVVRADLSN
jgi:hypothetical protein